MASSSPDRMDPFELGQVLAELEFQAEQLPVADRAAFLGRLRKLRAHTVAVTADDGYASVITANTLALEQALPLLQRSADQVKVEEAKVRAYEAWASFVGQVSRPGVTILLTHLATALGAWLASGALSPLVLEWLTQATP